MVRVAERMMLAALIFAAGLSSLVACQKLEQLPPSEQVAAPLSQEIPILVAPRHKTGGTIEERLTEIETTLHELDDRLKARTTR
jgi:hypothetical protein